ncbi:nuclear transport factor 2 family protein [Pseudonocardia sp. NPDC049635]|uniref:nuclear transport factor 2 family protein n=1 Tax=Pseudonocardia sp. NPDC049635 TaxID=3155506 RepID=UPI0033F10F44
MTAPHDLADRYFALSAPEHVDELVALFTDDALVTDDGHEYRGRAAIRRWRASVPAVQHQVLESGADGEGHLARVRISGDFPGSPVTLLFRFGVAGSLIGSLLIRPVPAP